MLSIQWEIQPANANRRTRTMRTAQYADRLRTAMEAWHGGEYGAQSAFAAALKRRGSRVSTRGMVRNYLGLDGGKPAMPPADFIVDAAAVLGVRLEWLLAGEGPMKDEEPIASTGAGPRKPRQRNRKAQLWDAFREAAEKTFHEEAGFAPRVPFEVNYWVVFEAWREAIRGTDRPTSALSTEEFEALRLNFERFGRTVGEAFAAPLATFAPILGEQSENFAAALTGYSQGISLGLAALAHPLIVSGSEIAFDDDENEDTANG
jgi:hypothetical protein